MDVTSIATLIMYVGLIIFLVVLSCIIYQFQSQVEVHYPGHFILQQQCQNDIQESRNMKNLQKMKKLRSDRKTLLNLSKLSQPKPTSNIWISNDLVVPFSKEMDELRVKDTNAPRSQSTQLSMYYQNEVTGGIREIMTSIKKDLENNELYLSGPEATKNLENTAIEEFTNSFNERKDGKKRNVKMKTKQNAK